MHAYLNLRQVCVRVRVRPDRVDCLIPYPVCRDVLLSTIMNHHDEDSTYEYHKS